MYAMREKIELVLCRLVIRWIIYIGFIMFILIYGSTSTTSDFIYANF